MLDLYLISFKFCSGNAGGLLDLFQDADDFLQIVVQNVEKLVNWKSRGH